MIVETGRCCWTGTAVVVHSLFPRSSFVELKVFQYTVEDGPIYFADVNIFELVVAFHILPMVNFCSKEMHL